MTHQTLDKAASDLLILVDAEDRELGYETKARCHDGAGILHRAFSVFLWNDRGELLLQQRSAEKRLWPGYWSNSCCSHPRKGEQLAAAALRRVHEELALTAELTWLFKFTYQAAFGTLGSEHELCSVFVGRTSALPTVDPSEIGAWRFVSHAELNRELSTSPERFTPWFKLEWQTLCREHGERLAALARARH